MWSCSSHSRWHTRLTSTFWSIRVFKDQVCCLRLTISKVWQTEGQLTKDLQVSPCYASYTIKQCKIHKNWCTVTVAPTIEHHGWHSRTPANQARPGAREESASPAWLAAPAMNACGTTKVYIWRLDTGCGPTLYRKCHSHNTPGKRHNNTWVEPLTGNCTTSSTRQREQVWQKCKIQKNWCTVTVARTIEHHSGHSRTPENQRRDQVPGRSQHLLLG